MAMLNELTLALLAGAIPETDVQEICMFDEDGVSLGSIYLRDELVADIEMIAQMYELSFKEALLLLFYNSANHINKQYTPPYVTAQKTIESRLDWNEYRCMQGVAP